MELTQTLRQTTRLAMTLQMQHSLQLLQMSTPELILFLENASAKNPALRVTLPRPLPRETSPRPEFGGTWDATAGLEAHGPGLYAYVSNRIETDFAAPRDKQIAYAFLDALEPSGWLGSSVDTVALCCDVPVAAARAVLRKLQQLEPTGLFACSLAECLLLQAEESGVLTWELETLIANLPLLAEGRTTELAELCDCAEEDIPEITAVLRGFDPKPGLQFANDLPPVFPPDLVASRTDEGWSVDLTRSTLPTLQVVEASTQDEDAKTARAEALALVAAVEKRQATLLRVGAALVRHQSAYLDSGPGHLRALTLDMIAGELDLHVSTVSRVCAGCLIAGPRGALPLKALFSRPVDALLGTAGPSQDALAAAITRLVEGENRARPLSDGALEKALAADGFRVARRTVAKYRQALGIPAVSKRRRRA
ncbi:RNA polymerase factor sigma-54 [Tropicimonas sp. S265A]|uniref:RNA polymerase factor sigma-54 n=1 Tax=Tropicimonas sp. S265A TaxID=3415134 RepID=UPI003C79FCF3